MQILNQKNEPAGRTRWNELFRQAKAGDKNAVHKLHLAARPLIAAFYKVPVFYNKLGRDEIRSLASYALVRYFSRHTGLPPDEEVPFLLRHVIYCELVSGVRKVNARKSFEQPAGSVGNGTSFPDGRADGCAAGETAAADRETEPEAQYLRNELCDRVRDAVRKLKTREQFVIRGFYYQHKNIATLAREMHCTQQNVRYTRRNAIMHLQELLKAYELA